MRLVALICICANRKANTMRQKYTVDDDLEFTPVLRIPKTYLTQLDKVRTCVTCIASNAQFIYYVCVNVCMYACLCVCVCVFTVVYVSVCNCV